MGSAMGSSSRSSSEDHASSDRSSSLESRGARMTAGPDHAETRAAVVVVVEGAPSEVGMSGGAARVPSPHASRA